MDFPVPSSPHVHVPMVEIWHSQSPDSVFSLTMKALDVSAVAQNEMPVYNSLKPTSLHQMSVQNTQF